MSFYRNLLIIAAAAVIASPVFANNNNTTNTTGTTQQTTGQGTTAATEKVNVNTATGKELLKIKGINAAKARAIVGYRKKHGNFKSLDELAKVKSLGKLKTDDLKKIQDQLTI